MSEKLSLIPGPGQEESDFPPTADAMTDPCNCRACQQTRPMQGGIIASLSQPQIPEKPPRGLADAEDRETTEQSRTAPAEHKRRKALGKIPTDTEDLKECCFEMRKALEEIKTRSRGLLHNHPALMRGATVEFSPPDTPGANLTLAYRHLEDARMRLGKAVQALDGGKSVYPR